MHELRYFQEIIAFSDCIGFLWHEKCQMIVNKDVRWCEALKIYFEGREEWVFDYLPSRKEASEYLTRTILDSFDVAKINNKCRYKGRK